MSDWLIYRGDGEPHDGIGRLPPPPPWRRFDPVRSRLGTERATTYRASTEEIELVNAALYLRRPLLVTGKPGTGKSTLAYSVAHELRLGDVLYWPITSRSTRQEGLYKYDAIARLQDTTFWERAAGAGEALDAPDADPRDIGRYLRLGALGTAFLPGKQPRVLLIDELDKSDIDLPNDLLTLFEEGEYEIPELMRAAKRQPEVRVLTHDGSEYATITGGKVRCEAFPLVIITSNEEREFPPAFLRRCLQLRIKPPDRERLTAIVRSHLGAELAAEGESLIEDFERRRADGDLATDQLLNAIYLNYYGSWPDGRDRLIEMVLQHLRTMDG
ncbi:AAA family ATPase [Actinomadura sp. SCN-SB]|uniref:AAA family ATPase n=1 Tax=Actinomadura sp. SCN-SB TaxID=3373092 RepID=UPI00375250F1